MVGSGESDEAATMAAPFEDDAKRM